MTYVKPRWKVEVRATLHPPYEWSEVRKPSGDRYAYVERGEAEQAMTKMQAVQPHAVFRVSPR